MHRLSTFAPPAPHRSDFRAPVIGTVLTVTRSGHDQSHGSLSPIRDPTFGNSCIHLSLIRLSWSQGRITWSLIMDTGPAEFNRHISRLRSQSRSRDTVTNQSRPQFTTDDRCGRSAGLLCCSCRPYGRVSCGVGLAASARSQAGVGVHLDAIDPTGHTSNHGAQ